MIKRIKNDIEVAFFFPQYMGIEKETYPIGIAYMAAYLKDKGIPVQYLSGCSKELIEFLEDVKKRGVKILGVPVYDTLFPHIKVVLQEARNILPGVLLVAGGPTATFADDVVLNNIPQVDIVVRGEGEETIHEIYQHVKFKTDIGKIKGISYRGKNRIIRNPARPLIGVENPRGSELDSLPSLYKTGILTGLEPAPEIQTSRGCVFNCNFCNGSELFGHRVRYHSIERVIEDLRIISKNVGSKSEPHRLDFWDDNFCVNKERTKHLCKAIIKENFNFYINIENRADLLDKETLEIMYKAGIRRINFGLESAVPKILRNLKKVNGISPDFQEEKKYIESVRNMVKLCNKLGIKATVNVIFGSPGETYKDGLITLKTIEDMNIKHYYHSRFSLFVGTEILKEIENYGIKIKHGEDVLPLRHDLPYDVSRIPTLPNAILSEYSYYFMQSVEKSLFEYWNENLSFQDYKPFFIFEDYHDINAPIIEWLKRNMRFHSYIILKFNKRKPQAYEIKLIKQKIRRAILPSMLKSDFLIFEKVIDRKGIKKYELKTDTMKHSLYWQSDYYLCPFRFAKENDKVNTEDAVVFCQINTRQDVLKFIKETKKVPENFRDSLIGKMLENDILVSSSCRFAGKICPAIKLRKIHVLNNGDLLTCEHGEKIGIIGDSIEKLENHVKAIAKKTGKERHCSACYAKKYCPRCLFTYPFTTEEYCNFIRESGWFRKILQFHFMCYNDNRKKMFYRNLRSGKNSPPISSKETSQ